MAKNQVPKGISSAQEWFEQRGWQPFAFQVEAWHAFAKAKDGVVNAPTGSGKTYSLLVPIVAGGIDQPERD